MGTIKALLPKEHGAYGQVAFPLATVLVIGHAGASALLLAVATVALFLAHEPLLIILGRRGPRVRAQHGREAVRWLAALCTIGVVGAVAALRQLSHADWWALVVPALPAAVLFVAIVRGAEKTGVSEACASCAFAGAALPVAVAGDVPAAAGAAVTVAFGVSFVLATLAVRAIILRVRGGGDPAAAGALRRAVLFAAPAALAGIGIACHVRLLPWTALAGSVPGLAVAVLLVLFPPPASRLRSVGWTLIGASVLTSGVLIAGLR